MQWIFITQFLGQFLDKIILHEQKQDKIWSKWPVYHISGEDLLKLVCFSQFLAGCWVSGMFENIYVKNVSIYIISLGAKLSLGISGALASIHQSKGCMSMVGMWQNILEKRNIQGLNL